MRARRNGQVISLTLDISFDDVEQDGGELCVDGGWGDDTDAAFRAGRAARSAGKCKTPPYKCRHAAAWRAGYKWQSKHGNGNQPTQPQRKAATSR